MQQYRTDGYDGKQIFVTLFDDVVSPKAVLMIVHGMGEYVGRFERLAKYFNSKGYIVFADDHRAHGRTESDEDRGKCSGNIFADTLKDEVLFYEKLKEKYNLPVFLLGHSYGSFLAQAFAEAGTDCKAIGLIGTAHMGRLLMGVGAALLYPLHLIAGNWRSSLPNKCSSLLFRYKGDKGPAQWVVKDLDSRVGFLNDKMCNVPMSIDFCYYMLKETGKLYSSKSRAKLKPTTAIGMFCGADDPIGGKGAKVKKLDKMYRALNIPTEVHIYDGVRHEVHNDVSKTKAMKDMVKFFDKYIVYQQASIDDLLK